MTGPVRNAADPQQQQRAKERQRLAELQRHDDWTAVLSLPGGARVVRELLIESGVFLPAPIAAGDLAIAEFEGRRKLGLSILNRVRKFSPELLAQMMREDTDG